MRNLIPPFVRPMMRLVGTNDRGAVGVLVGILLSTGVLLGMAALTVDVGIMYQERAELQNGADAGSIAVAKTCVQNPVCNPVAADNYANHNSKDSVSAVTLVCGQGPGLDPCQGPWDTRNDDTIVYCSEPEAGTNYVDVHTATKTTSGSTLLPPVFSRALAGNGSYQGDTVVACARAKWGRAMPGSKSLAMTLSQCTWDLATNGGTTYGVDFPIPLRDRDAPTGACNSGAGEFGWLDDIGECTADIDIDIDVEPTEYSAENDPGADVSNACKDALKSHIENETLLYIPIFSSTSLSGNNAIYELVGLAAFIVTGYANMPGLRPQNHFPPGFTRADCPNGPGTSSCIFGHFTQALVPVSTTVGSGTDFGATAIKLAG